MKKWQFALLLTLLTILLAACGGEGDETKGNVTKSDDDKTLKFGATAGPYSDMLKEAIIPGLEEKGYTVEVMEFSDYIQPNNALASGEIDANLFQHTIYLENFAEENKMDLTGLIIVPTAPLGLFTEKFNSVEEITDGAQIAIPNDPVNAARTLNILVDQGLIEVDDTVEPLKVSEKDITSNPKNLKVLPLEAGQLPRSVESTDIAAVPGNFALAANMDLMDAIALENMPDQFRNVVAVTTANKDAQFAKDIEEVVQSAAFEAVIDEKFKGFGKPEWMLSRK